MNPRMFEKFTRSERSWHRAVLCSLSLLLVLLAGCAPAATQPPEQPASAAADPATIEPTATELPSAPTATEPPAPSPTAASENLAPAGWLTYTSQNCGVELSYPPDMSVDQEGSFSRSLSFDLADPSAGARNFIYLSAVPLDDQGLEVGEIYNYDPAETALLLAMDVGESKAVRDIPGVAENFTYQRLPDATIDGRPAQAFENRQPWEFPEGTLELRYYLSLESCTYMVGAYLDTVASGLPGAITADLFQQIVDTIHLMP